MSTSCAVLRVTHQSWRVAPGGTFVAIRGARSDGAAWIADALSRGATRVVIQVDHQISDDVLHAIRQHAAELVHVENVRRAFAELSAEAYGYPARDLTIIGITGTKGKTTTSFLLFHLLRSAGIRAALFSTVHNQILDEIFSTDLTTQQPDCLHAMLAHARDRGCTHVVLETAAQAVTLDRVYGIVYDVAVWTNFSREHGEFYASDEAYFAAKAQLFQMVRPGGVALLPSDDLRIAGIPLPDGVAREIYQVDARAREQVPSVRDGVVWYDAGEEFRCPALLGSFQCANITAAVRCAERYGVTRDVVRDALRTFAGVPGRCNLYRLSRDVTACIDYAHTPSSVEAILSALRPCTQQLIVVTGCGGDRDRAKRPVIAARSVELGDYLILTTDNPRSEEPSSIIQEMYQGIPEAARSRVAIELDRAAAIAYAYQIARPGAIIALLGKGPDEYQIVGTVKYPFSERACLLQLQ